MSKAEVKKIIDEINWKKKVGGFYPDQRDEEGRKQYNKAISDVIRFLQTLND